MEITGEQVIALPQQAVWEALNDPEVLKQCIPGCETVEKLSDSDFTIAMVAAVGPVKAKFTGKLKILEPNPPDSYFLSFEGSGGVAGFGKGQAEVILTMESDTVTVLSYKANATVGGKLAQVGSRLIDGVARKIADAFFERFNQALVPAADPGAGAAEDKPAKRWSLFGRRKDESPEPEQ